MRASSTLYNIMKLSKTYKDKLWGEDGPYSEVQLIVETRILDDEVSRIFIIVEVHINPFTFELIQRNRKLFENDPMIQDLLTHSEFRGQSFGYVSCTFQHEYIDEVVMDEARKRLEYTKQVIFKMHKFVLNIIKETAKN